MSSVKQEYDEVFIVHFRESPTSPQWEEEWPTKAQADTRAFQIYTDGGIAIVVPQMKPASASLIEQHSAALSPSTFDEN